MNFTNRLASALLAAAVLVVPVGMTAARAQTNVTNPAAAASPHPHHGAAMRKMLESLNLSDAQNAQIKQIMQNTRAQNQNADPQTRHANTSKAWDQIRNQVLTADQRAQFDAQVKAYRAAHPGGPGGPAPVASPQS